MSANVMSARMWAQVFVSETNYFDKKTKCVAIEIRGHSNWIREAIGAYAKIKGLAAFSTKFFYISFQDVLLPTTEAKSGDSTYYKSKSAYYKIHFKLSPTKMDSLYYLYLLVLDTDNHFLPERGYRAVYQGAAGLLLQFYHYYQHVFLVEKALQIAEKRYATAQMHYAWLSADSSKIIRNLLNDTGNLYRALERSKADLRVKDSSFKLRKTQTRQELWELRHKLDSLENLRQANLKKYPL